MSINKEQGTILKRRKEDKKSLRDKAIKAAKESAIFAGKVNNELSDSRVERLVEEYFDSLGVSSDEYFNEMKQYYPKDYPLRERLTNAIKRRLKDGDIYKGIYFPIADPKSEAIECC